MKTAWTTPFKYITSSDNNIQNLCDIVQCRRGLYFGTWVLLLTVGR